MARIKGRALAIFIAPDGVRICEGENRDGNPEILKFFTVSGVSEYFTYSSGRSEITNMTGLVDAIASECKNRNILTRKCLVCSECFNMSTEIEHASSGRDLKSISQMDVKDVFALGKNKEKIPPDKLFCTRSWGSVPVDGKLTYTITKTFCDKYTVESFTKEMYKRGYTISFLGGDSEVLLNFKQTEAANFDSRGKIIFNVSNDIKRATFVQDVLVEFDSMGIPTLQSTEERLLTLCNEMLEVTGRRPKVYLAGPAFKDPELYVGCIDFLQENGFPVCDLFNRPTKDPNYEEMLSVGDVMPLWTADYSANIALFMCPFAKTLIDITPKIGISDIFQSNSKAGATVAVAVTSLLFIGSLVTGGFAVSKVIEQRDNPVQLDNLQSQIMSLTARQSSLQSTINTLTKADPTALELIDFIVKNNSSDIRVVSVDTRDMLTVNTTVDQNSDSDIITGGVSNALVSRENIIVRGYAKTGPAAISYFDKMFNCGLPVDPVLNGIERYTLPMGEEVYIFEIEIGGVVG